MGHLKFARLVSYYSFEGHVFLGHVLAGVVHHLDDVQLDLDRSFWRAKVGANSQGHGEKSQ